MEKKHLILLNLCCEKSLYIESTFPRSVLDRPPSQGKKAERTSGGCFTLKILVVEDNNDLATEILTLLTAKRMTAERVATIGRAKDFLASSQYDLIILDWNLPDATGIELLKSLRAKSIHTPVLLLTQRSTILDKTEGFAAGTDDYLTKPFHPTELLCRIEALLRRPPVIVPKAMSCGSLSLDPDARRARRNGEEISLSPKEYSLLEFFMRNQDQVFTPEALLERVWETDSESTSQTVVATILRLRKKIDEQGSTSYIKNQFGQGYLFSDNVK